MKEKEIQEGRYYSVTAEHGNKDTYFFKSGKSGDASYEEHISKSEGKAKGNISWSNSNFKDCDYKELSYEESLWFDACMRLGKYVPFDEFTPPIPKLQLIF